MQQNEQQIAYLNGQFLPIEAACISTQDRGFLFGDGVYEVIPVYQKRIFEFEAHLQRLKNSLQATHITNPMNDEAWQQLCQNLVDQHPWQDQSLYLQVTRGIQMHRDHLPEADLTPTVYAYTTPLTPLPEKFLKQGISVITLDDIRWLRCDIKAITLLPNVLMKMAAKQRGVDDAILISRDGFVTEGTANNVFMVKDGTLYTPPTDNKILAGITRKVIEAIAEAHHIPLYERPITAEALDNADEIWLTSSTKEALPVTQLNGKAVGEGKPGPLWHTIRQYYQAFKQAFIQQNPPA